MKITLEPGRYVVAVSGGVDSMALLHALCAHPGLRLTVAHFDHGIRPDSHEDVMLVQKTVRQYGLPFVYGMGGLGPKASEESARKARYDFLHKVKDATDAQAIITAHHKDDVLETAVINMLRGTGRKGLSSLKSLDGIKRPLLHHTKSEIIEYARTHNLEWREDSTNNDPSYLRNHVRHDILSRISPKDKKELHGIIEAVRDINEETDELLEKHLQKYTNGGRLRRREFIMLPHAVALEVMAAWLRAAGIRTFDKKMLERLVHAAKIHIVGRRVAISSTVHLKISGEFLALERSER